MLLFDENALTSRIECLVAPLRVTFAAACAERQMEGYRSFCRSTGWTDPSQLESALDQAWRNPAGRMGEPWFGGQIEALMEFIPFEDRYAGRWSQQVSVAESAGMSVLYTLRTQLSGTAQEAAYSARVAYETLDDFVIGDRFKSGPVPEAEVVGHPLIQQELSRQERDWLDLMNVGYLADLSAVVSAVQQRAKQEAFSFFIV